MLPFPSRCQNLPPLSQHISLNHIILSVHSPAATPLDHSVLLCAEFLFVSPQQGYGNAEPFVEQKDNTPFVPTGAPVVSSSPRPHPWYPETTEQCLLSYRCFPAVVKAMMSLALPGTRTIILSPSTVSRWSVELLPSSSRQNGHRRLCH